MQIADIEAEADKGRMTMSLWKVKVTAVNPAHRNRETEPIETLVDTGAELTWLQREKLLAVGILPERKKRFQTATKQLIEREVGYAIVRAEGQETNDEIVFAEPGEMNLLGVRTLEGFAVTVDPIAHRFVATTTIVAGFFRPGSQP